MSTGAPDQAQRVDEADGLNGRYKLVDGYDDFMFVDKNTNWLELFSLERSEPEGSDGGSPLLFLPGLPGRSRSKSRVGGIALFGAGLALLIAGVMFVPRPAAPPTALARGPVEAPAPLSEATAAQPDITPLTPPSPEPAPAPEPGPVTVPATASAPVVASLPASTAPAVDRAATRPASVPAAPVTTAASTDAPPIFVPAVQPPPESAPSTPVAVALEAVATTPPVATPAPTSNVPSVTVAAPPAAAPPAATAAVTPPPAVAAVVSARELETRAIQTVLGRYREAYNALDARRAFDVWPSVNEKDLARAFESIEEQELSFDQCRIDVAGAKAEAACTGTARFVPRVGNRVAKAQARRWQFAFRKVASGWVIDRVEAR